jgi:hypothetical protein
MNRMTILLGGLFATLMIATSAAAVPFYMTTYENADNADVSDLNLWFDVTDGGTFVDFAFYNGSTTASIITNIYFESSGAGLQLGASSIEEESAGVDFSPGGNPANPVQNAIDWAGTEANFRARNPAPHNGIGISSPTATDEWLKIRFDYGQSGYSDVISDLQSGDFRVAQHVTGLPSSIWTVSSEGPTDPVPLPASIWLLGSGLISWAGSRRLARRRR